MVRKTMRVKLDDFYTSMELWGDYFLCRKCDSANLWKSKAQKGVHFSYCPDCGVKLDWSEVEKAENTLKEGETK